MEIYLGIVIALLFSAFFSGMEIAFFSSNKIAVELKGKENKRSGKIIAGFFRNKSNFIGATLIGNNISLVVFTNLMAIVLADSILHFTSNEFLVLLLETIFVTVIVLCFGEFIPKTLFRINPVGILTFFAIPFRAFSMLLSPLVFVTVRLAKAFMKYVLRIQYVESTPAFSKVDLQHFISQNNHDDVEDNDIDTDLFENALYLTHVKARECMVPRPEIQAVDVNSSVGELKNMFIETGLSRIIVYDGDIDNILGYVHHFELLSQPQKIKPILMKAPLVPETMLARDLSDLFKKERKSMAWVVDEYGGTAGIVTMEDVLEELFGEIQDEHDEEEFMEKKESETTYLFSGRLEIDYLNDKYDLNLPEADDYETLAGYIVSQHESIPVRNDKIKLDDFEFDILAVSNTKIETVRLIALKGPQ
jgi:CBS domain containing-hemolysin-like protein